MSGASWNLVYFDPQEAGGKLGKLLHCTVQRAQEEFSRKSVQVHVDQYKWRKGGDCASCKCGGGLMVAVVVEVVFEKQLFIAFIHSKTSFQSLNS